MPPAKNLPESEKKARQKTYSARYYAKHRAQIQKKVKAYKDNKSVNAVSSKEDEKNQEVGETGKAWDDSRACEEGTNRQRYDKDDPRLGFQPHFNKNENTKKPMFFHDFKPKNKPIWGCNQASAKCGKLVDTVRFD